MGLNTKYWAWYSYAHMEGKLNKEDRMRLKLKEILVPYEEPVEPIEDLKGQVERHEITRRIAKTDRGGFQGVIRLNVGEYLRDHPIRRESLEKDFNWNFETTAPGAGETITFLASSHTMTLYTFGAAAIRNVYPNLTDAQCGFLSELLASQAGDIPGEEIGKLGKQKEGGDKVKNPYVDEGFKLEFTRAVDGQDIPDDAISIADRFVYDRNVAFEIAKAAGQVPQDMSDDTLLQTEHGVLLNSPHSDE